MISVGCDVIYGSQGVCRVQEIRRENFSGTEKEYYLLKPLDDPKMIIFVPTDATDLVKQMRPLLTTDELSALLCPGVTIEALEWISDPRARADAFEAIIRRGDRRELLAMLRALYIHREQQLMHRRKLYIGDENACQRAERLLHGEIAAILHIAPNEVPAYIQNRIASPQVADTNL